jgi:hypothetical protein
MIDHERTNGSAIGRGRSHVESRPAPGIWERFMLTMGRAWRALVLDEPVRAREFALESATPRVPARDPRSVPSRRSVRRRG